MKILKWILFELFMLVKNTLVYNLKGAFTLVRQWKNNLKNFKEKPYQNIISITIPLLTFISIITFVVIFIIFISTGGYKAQTDISTTENFMNGFTSRPISNYFNGIVQTIIGILAIVSFIAFCISYFKEDKNREFLKLLLTSLLLTYIIIPLLLLLVTNIVALVILIVFLVIFYFGLSFFVGGTIGETEPINTSTNKKSNSNNKSVENNKLKISEWEQTSKQEGDTKIINVPSSFKVYRAEGMLGDKYIERIGFNNTRDKLCSIEDYEKGKVIIMQNGKKLNL